MKQKRKDALLVTLFKPRSCPSELSESMRRSIFQTVHKRVGLSRQYTDYSTKQPHMMVTDAKNGNRLWNLALKQAKLGKTLPSKHARTGSYYRQPQQEKYTSMAWIITRLTSVIKKLLTNTMTFRRRFLTYDCNLCQRNILTLKYENIVRTSSSKPISIILSASSKHKYRQTSRLIIFLSSMSMRRPGVAVIICTPLQLHHSPIFRKLLQVSFNSLIYVIYQNE